MTNHTEQEYRDLELGAALAELVTPQHRRDFDERLRRRLADEHAAARRRSHIRWGVRIALVAAVAAVAVVAVGIPKTHHTPGIAGPQPAAAAIVKSHLRSALTTLRTLRGVLTVSGPAQRTPQQWRFALDTAGDVRIEGPAAGDVETFDAASGVVRSAQHSASLGGDTIFYAERRGVAPGEPDLGPPTWILPNELGAYVRAALAASSPSVRDTIYGGRPAWRLDVATIPNAVAPELSGDALSITVDRETGMPVQIIERKDGATLRELRIQRLVVDEPLPAATFRLDFPAGAEVVRSDEGFRHVALDEIVRTVGYQPIVPSRIPQGYRLTEVAVARDGASTGKEGGNPPSRMVASLSYRRGTEQFLVTTRLRGSGPWSDPLASPEGFVDHPETVMIRTGALAGTDAQLVLSPRAVPHIWALAGQLVITIGGDLTRSELEVVANSLRTN
jgi:hypothetical protein